MGEKVSEEKARRKLAAIMFTDMVGFSRAMHRNEQHALGLLDEHDKLTSKLIKEHRGRILKTMGDAIFAEFHTATEAVTCAIQIQTALCDFNFQKDPGEQIVIRIGIHVGEVIVRGDDLFGDGINVAARLQPLSAPGGICLSKPTYQAIRSQLDVKPILVGEVELKNILEKHVIYQIPSFYAGFVDEDRSSAGSKSGSLSFKLQGIQQLPPPKRSRFACALFGAAMMIAAGLIPAFAAYLSSFQGGKPPKPLSEQALMIYSTYLVASALLGAVTFIIFYSLTTLRVSFKDVRNVDVLLEVLICEMGFRPPQKQGESIVFRATFWTWFTYCVLRVKANVSGNRVFLTGPMLLMRRLEKRLLQFADEDSG